MQLRISKQSFFFYFLCVLNTKYATPRSAEHYLSLLPLPLPLLSRMLCVFPQGWPLQVVGSPSAVVQSLLGSSCLVWKAAGCWPGTSFILSEIPIFWMLHPAFLVYSTLSAAHPLVVVPGWRDCTWQRLGPDWLPSFCLEWLHRSVQLPTPESPFVITLELCFTSPCAPSDDRTDCALWHGWPVPSSSFMEQGCVEEKYF